MDTANCKMAAVENVKNDMDPNIRLDPIFKTMAITMTKINKNGSIHDVVVRVNISQMITNAIPIAMVISFVMDSSLSLLDTALPAK